MIKNKIKLKINLQVQIIFLTAFWNLKFRKPSSFEFLGETALLPQPLGLLLAELELDMMCSNKL